MKLNLFGYILMVVLIVLVMPAFSQRNRDTTRRYLDADLNFVSRSKAIYEGVSFPSKDHWGVYAFYPNTDVVVKSFFLDKDLKVKDGPFQLFHPGNKPAILGNFKNNRKQGVWKFSYLNGAPKDSGMLLDDVMVGIWKSWYPNGRLKLMVKYSDEPVSSDASVQQRGNSKSLIYNLSPISGIKTGEWINNDSIGNPVERGSYVEDKKHGYWKSFWPGGKPESEGNFKTDSIEGDWIFYYESGTVSTKEKYKNGKVVSMECFDEKGNATGSACSILKPAVPLGRFSSFNDYVLDNVFWPKELKNSDVMGDVKVRYTISKEGKLKSFTVIESPHELLSKEVERFFRSIESWSPAISHNRIIENTQEYLVPFYK